jgi:D-alanine-D-alanine ligase
MKIGITFDLKNAAPHPGGEPDDFDEEFDDPSTVASIAEVLCSLGHRPIELGNGPQLLRQLVADPPDFVFNFAEGQGIGRSREARVPAVLELLGIPYTGSDPATLGLCLDKDWARRLAASAGIPTPRGLTLPCGTALPAEPAALAAMLAAEGLEPPVLAKPTCEGSSKGIRNKCLITNLADLASTVAELWRLYRQPVVVEEFIDGDELTVGILGNGAPEVIGIMRVVPRRKTGPFFYSLEVKRDWKNLVDYECPARIGDQAAAAVCAAALDAYAVLGCRDVARLDFRLRNGVPYFIEANPLPGLNPHTGDLVQLAGKAGVSHAQLIERILRAAIERQVSLIP